MTLSLMTDERQGQLMKAAEATVGLMNIGVDANAALAKVAADQLMNEQEIDLVAHAVNNSRQLALLQTAQPEDREKPFALVDPQRVKAIKPEPETNQETSTELRYGLDDRPAGATVAKIDAPDAVGIQKNVEKKANYHQQSKIDHAAVLRAGWALDVPKMAEHVTEHVWADEQRRQHKVAHVRQVLATAQDTLCTEVDQLGQLFRSTSAPKFAEVELAARCAGVDQPFIDLVFDAANLEALNIKRAAAGPVDEQMFVSPDVLAAVRSFDRIVGLTKVAGGLMFDLEQLTKHADGEKPGKHDIAIAPTEFENDSLSGAAQSLLGVSDQPSDDAQAFLGTAPPESKDRPALMDMLPSEGRQNLGEASEQLRLKRLLQDKYVSGHSVPEVVDAYNAALAVNPNFGDSELTSYVRQHLATKGGVPLDLQIRARGEGDE